MDKLPDFDNATVRTAIAEAVRKRAPREGYLGNWYFAVQEGSGVGEETLAPLCRKGVGSNLSLLNFFRLCRLWGPSFADDCLAALTGVRCTAEPAESDQRLKFLETELQGLSKFAGGEGELPERGAPVSDLDDRRQA